MEKLLLILFLIIGAVSISAEEIPTSSDITVESNNTATSQNSDIPPALPATLEPETKNDHSLISAGVGQRSTSWMSWPKSWERTDYNVETANHTIVEGDLSIPSISTKLGFNIHQDSGNLSTIKQYAGYIGFGSLSLRAEKGKFAGSVFFEGPVITGESQTTFFNQEYLYTELTFNMSSILPEQAKDFHYLGFRYTKWYLPSELYLTQDTRAFTIMDHDFQSEFYTFILGEDSFTDKIIFDAKNWKAGWGLMKSYVLGVGYGSCRVSKEAKANTKTLYNLEMTETKYPIMAGHISGQLGPMYGISIFDARLAIGIGYDINFLFIGKSPFTSVGSALHTAPTIASGEADVSTFPMFLYHGPILRIHGAF